MQRRGGRAGGNSWQRTSILADPTIEPAAQPDENEIEMLRKLGYIE